MPLLPRLLPVTKQPRNNILKTLKQVPLQTTEFSAEYGSVGLISGSSVLINRFQPYGGGTGNHLNSALPE